jgi:hypothetical protein
VDAVEGNARLLREKRGLVRIDANEVPNEAAECSLLQADGRTNRMRPCCNWRARPDCASPRNVAKTFEIAQLFLEVSGLKDARDRLE